MNNKSNFLMFILSLLICISCANADSLIEIYEQGIEDVQKCNNGTELQDLTYRVKEQLLDVAKRPGGNEKMSEEETQRVMDAQNKFERAVEERARQVPQY